MKGTEDTARWSAARGSDSPCVTLAEARSPAAQGAGIAREIRRAEEAGIPLQEQCILCRTNAQANGLAQALTARGIPTLYLGPVFERPEIKDMLALLSLLTEGNLSALLRVGRFPEYSLCVDELVAAVQSLEQAAELRWERLEPLQRLARHVRSLPRNGDAFQLLARYLFGAADYLRALLRDDTVPSRQRRLALYQLLLLARAYSQRAGQEEENSARAFLSHVRRLVSAGEDTRVRVPARSDLPAVRIMTAHAAKGLEFRCVFVPNMAHGLFPPRKPGSLVTLPPALAALDDGGGSDEEEALFFVALSRARDRLVISRPVARAGKELEPSPLLLLLEAQAHHAVELVGWRGDAEALEETAGEPPVGDADAEYSVAELELYMRCPRRYYYRHTLRLRGRLPETPYSQSQACIQETLEWLETEQKEGLSPGEEGVRQYLEERWAARLTNASPNEEALRERAEAIVLNAARTRAPATVKTQDLVARLPSGRVRVDPGKVIEEDGALHAEEWRWSTSGTTEHAAPRHALRRLALQQTYGASAEIRLQVRDLSAGEVRPIPEQPRYEPARVAKYDAAIAGIQRCQFPAQPDAPAACPRCAFYFICPA